MKTKSFLAYDIKGLELELHNTLQGNFNPTLSIVFCHPNLEIEEACQIFKKNNIQLMGCTTAGEIHDNVVSRNSISVLLLELPEDMFSIHSVEALTTNYFEPGKKLGNIAKQKFNNPAILVYTAGIGIDGESVVSGIKDCFEAETLIFGGMAADNFEIKRSRVFTHKKVSEGGLVGLILDADQINIDGNTFSGWNGLGRMHTITKAEGNVLLEVDNDQPALDLFNKYFKGISYKVESATEELFTIASIYALKINRSNGTEIMRSTLLFDLEKKALVLAGGVKEGETFRFCPAPDYSVVEKTIKEFSNAKIAQADAVIMTSCAARNIVFGPMYEDEVAGIYDLWKVPTVGILSYGEIGNVSGQNICEFHNVTCSIMTLSLKSCSK